MRPTHINSGDYYRMLKPVGCCDMKGYRHYALWQPLKKIKFLWFNFYVKKGQKFLLDMYGFEEIK